MKCLSPNRIEQKLMEIACPLTCGYCIENERVTTSTVIPEKSIMPTKCIDEADDCADRINFCNRKFYKRMMSLQCARTCKFCDPDDEYEEEEAEDSREIHLSTLRSKMGEETVKKLEELKIVDSVIDLLKNATSSSLASKPRRFSKKPTATTNFSSEVTETECVDTASDCERNTKLCTHKAYTSLFRKICAKTCEYCELADSTIDLESSGEDFF
ncbi:Protein CBG04629 [Caenorhabditis briggsae]|uniref:Protein CBG04629 n=1 Tax=Caenorhabditis briggsae TaxID=6238 RepID=A8WY37_CAEBR|nr:Protein CBG04629 [Caenorhabditis briggsae]CAP25297.2 Protein CBG04629 [Caenorhabditis briggsae]